MAKTKKKNNALNLSVIHDINVATAFRVDLDEVLKIIVDKACEVLRAEIGSILLVDADGKSLVIKAAKHLSHKIIETTRLHLGEKISGWIAKHRKPLLVKNIETDPRFAKRNSERYYTKSFISAPLIVRDQLVGVININNKKNCKIFNESDLRLLKAIALQAALAIENARVYENLHRGYLQTIKLLTEAMQARDHYTYTHSQNVTKYALKIADEMKLNEDEMKALEHACQLHDLGKIGIKDDILNKPGSLTDQEWAEIKTHPSIGAHILESLPLLEKVTQIIRQHHERYDGTGYPGKTKGTDICLGARIIMVVDSYDAMVTSRPYRKTPRIHEEVIKELTVNRNKQFDPKIVDVFLKVLEKDPSLKKS